MRRLLMICLLIVSTGMLAQQLPKIKGSGNVTLKEFEIEEPFGIIDIDGDFDIELSQGSSSLYTIETDDNLIDIFQFRVEENTLKISATHRVVKKKKFKITLTANTISEIHLNNNARIKGDGLLEGENLIVTAGKSSKFDLDVDYSGAVKVELFSNADGTIKTKSESNKTTLDGRANLKMYATADSFESEINDTSKLTLDGALESVKLNLSGNGKLRAKDASFTTTDITLSDSADAYIQVKEEITLYAQDSSELQLYGEPTITVTGLKNKAKILKKE